MAGLRGFDLVKLDGALVKEGAIVLAHLGEPDEAATDARQTAQTLIETASLAGDS